MQIVTCQLDIKTSFTIGAAMAVPGYITDLYSTVRLSK